jgi:hypothetical protein
MMRSTTAHASGRDARQPGETGGDDVGRGAQPLTRRIKIGALRPDAA